MNFLRKNLLYLILIAAMLVVAFVPGVKESLKETFLPVATVESAVTVDEASFDIKLKGINTASTNLKNLRNNKLIFLNFWGTWCAPCRKEWPSIQTLYDAKKDKMDFVLIAMQDKEEDVIKFILENNYTAPVYIAQSPINGKILPKVFPTTYILDKNGKILMKEDASKDWNSSKVHEFIDNLTQ